MYGRNGREYLVVCSFVFFISLIFSMVYANTQVSVSPSTLWLNDNLDARVDVICPLNYTYSAVYGTIRDGSGAFINLNGFLPSQTNAFFLNIDELYIRSGQGLYTVEVFCKVNDTTIFSGSTTFEVNNLDIDLLSPKKSDSLELYIDDTLEISFQLRLNGQYLTSNDVGNVEAYLVESGSGVEHRLTDFVLGSDNNNILITSNIPSNLGPGMYDIKLTMDYNYNGDIKSAELIEGSAVYIKYPLQMEIISPDSSNIQKILETKDEIIILDITEKGQKIYNLTESNFDVYLKSPNEKIPLDINSIEFDASKERYKLNVTINAPSELTNDVYNLYLTLRGVKSYRDVTDSSLEYVFLIPFKGTLASGINDLIARITFKNTDTEDTTIIKDTYNLGVIKGDYDIYLYLPEITKITLKNVHLDEPFIDLMKYYHTKSKDTIDWIKTIKIVVFEFGGAYDEAVLEIPYNDADVLDERNLVVYQCKDWNYGRKECSGDWTNIDADKNVVSNILKIATKSLGAFLIGEIDQLLLESGFDKSNSYAGELISYSGIVRNSKGDPVQEVNVSYRVIGEDIRGSVITNENGEFTISFNAPLPKAGSRQKSYTIEVTANKNGYKSITKEGTFISERRLSLAASMPDVVETIIGNESTVIIKVVNDGQVDLKNMEFKVAGIKDGWYSLTPSFIESLQEGDSSEVQLKIKIPEEDCLNETCEDYYFVQVRAKTDEISEDMSFTLKVANKKDLFSKIKNISDKSYFGKSLDKITGYFSFSGSSTSSTNMYIIFGFILLAYIIVTFKKIKSKKAKRGPVFFPGMGKRRIRF